MGTPDRVGNVGVSEASRDGFEGKRPSPWNPELRRYRQQFCANSASRWHGYSLSRDAFRYRREPHSLSATYFRRATTSTRADLPSGKVPTTRVHRLISLLSRSMALFVRMRRQGSRGVSHHVSVSAKPSRATFAASFSLIGSSSAATDPALADAASRDSMEWMALSMAATCERFDLGTLARTLR